MTTKKDFLELLATLEENLREVKTIDLNQPWVNGFVTEVHLRGMILDLYLEHGISDNEAIIQKVIKYKKYIDAVWDKLDKQEVGIKDSINEWLLAVVDMLVRFSHAKDIVLPRGPFKNLDDVIEKSKVTAKELASIVRPDNSILDQGRAYRLSVSNTYRKFPDYDKEIHASEIKKDEIDIRLIILINQHINISMQDAGSDVDEKAQISFLSGLVNGSISLEGLLGNRIKSTAESHYNEQKEQVGKYVEKIKTLTKEKLIEPDIAENIEAVLNNTMYEDLQDNINKAIENRKKQDEVTANKNSVKGYAIVFIGSIISTFLFANSSESIAIISMMVMFVTGAMTLLSSIKFLAKL